MFDCDEAEKCICLRRLLCHKERGLKQQREGKRNWASLRVRVRVRVMVTSRWRLCVLCKKAYPNKH